MEALILILGEMIFALLAPLVAAVVNLFGAALAAVFSFFPQRRREPRFDGRVARKILNVLLIAAAVLFAALLVVNRFYFAESVRTVFGVLEDRAGIETRCAEVSGNLFSGRISLEECTIVRTDHAHSEFQLQLDRADFDLQVTSLFGTADVQTAHVAGVRGTIMRHQSQEGADDAANDRPRRAFVIRDLQIEDAAIELAGFNKDGRSFQLPVAVVSASSEQLRSRMALFDILFRSNARGEIAGAEFLIETGGDSAGRQTVWRASDVPVAKFGAMAGGVLSWFHQGVVDVYIEDSWRRDGQLEIDMDWNLGFRDIQVQAPDSAGVLTRIATGPIVNYVNSRGGDFPFEFQMVINESQFEYKSSLAAAGLWDAVGESINNLLTEFGVEVDTSASETGETLREEAKSLLDRLRNRE